MNRIIALLLAAVFALTACSDGPSDIEMVEANMEAMENGEAPPYEDVPLNENTISFVVEELVDQMSSSDWSDVCVAYGLIGSDFVQEIFEQEFGGPDFTDEERDLFLHSLMDEFDEGC